VAALGCAKERTTPPRDAEMAVIRVTAVDEKRLDVDDRRAVDGLDPLRSSNA
jgi:hypothetical protein